MLQLKISHSFWLASLPVFKAWVYNSKDRSAFSTKSDFLECVIRIRNLKMHTVWTWQNVCFYYPTFLKAEVCTESIQLIFLGYQGYKYFSLRSWDTWMGIKLHPLVLVLLHWTLQVLESIAKWTQYAQL